MLGANPNIYKKFQAIAFFTFEMCAMQVQFSY